MSTFTRRDGRMPNELRPITIKFDGLARVDGSARFSFGEDTCALASVSGPIEVRLASEIPSKATFEVIVRPLSGIPATESKLLSTALKSCLEPSLILTKNPRTLVQLVIQSLSSPHTSVRNETLTAAMINASTLAFLQAGSVPMQGVVVAVAVGRLPDGTLVLDPSEDESEKLQGGGSFAFKFSDEDASHKSRADCVWSNWKVTTRSSVPNELFAARELAKTGATLVYDALRKKIETLGGATEFRSQATPIKDEENSHSSSDGEDEKMEI